MKVEQVASILNETYKELTGKEAIVENDCSNIVQVGKEIQNLTNYKDSYVKSIVNKVGKTVIVDRIYKGRAPSVLMDGWEFGSIKEKISIEIPVAQDNDTWKLVDGTSYDPNVFTAPTVSAKFFNDSVTFSVKLSITETQVKQSFQSAAQMNAFISMIYNAMANAITVRLNELIMLTINNFIGETIYAEGSSTTSPTTTGIRAINLKALYKDEVDSTYAKSFKQALLDKDFTRFMSMKMNLYADRLQSISSLYNIGGKDRFTPADRLHTVILKDVDAAVKTYLYDANGQFKDGNLQLPAADVVPFWQGNKATISGTTYTYTPEATGRIKLKTSGGHQVEYEGIIACMFDHEALGVCNMYQNTATHLNEPAEFVNVWMKNLAQYFNDQNEQFIVFFYA